MPNRADTRSTVHIQTSIITSAADGLASMQPHSHSERCALGPGMLCKRPLPRNGRRNRVFRSEERHQKRVPPPLDLPAVCSREGGAEKPAVLFLDFRLPVVAEALKERGGPLDVGEEEGNSPGRQAWHARPPEGTSAAVSNQRRSAGLARFPRSLVPGMPPSQVPRPPILQLLVGLGIKGNNDE